MTIGDPQISGLGNYQIGVSGGTTGLMITCSMDNNMFQAPGADADAFFQAFVNHLSTMPGVTLTGAVKGLGAVQFITPDSPTP